MRTTGELEEQVRRLLRRARAETGMPVLFGGLVDSAALPLTGFVGTRTGLLKDLTIGTRLGLGGRVIDEARPGQVVDYFRSQAISHEYDQQVGAEGIETLVAVPAVVAGRTRAVMYGGLRSVARVPDRMMAVLAGLSAELAQQIAVDDEVTRRLTLLGAVEPGETSEALALAVTESILELDELAGSTADPELAAALANVGERLRAARAPRAAPTIRLSAREQQVLGHLALGSSNREIAERLGLQPETVKSYVRNLFSKLEVRNRREAVVTARRLGLLP